MNGIGRFGFCLILLGTVIYALNATQFVGSFMLGFCVLPIPFHVFLYRLVRKAWVMNFSWPVVGEIALGHVALSLFLGMCLYVVGVIDNRPFFGVNARDILHGFLFGAGMCTWYYFWRFLATNWSKGYMLRTAFLPFMLAEFGGVAVIAGIAYLR